MDAEFKPYKQDEVLGDCYKHPTFGIISICRTHGGRTPLFGSSIIHNNTIRLTISHAELNRSLNTDRIFDKERIVEVEMSPTQFADAITGLNVGCGTPVRIRWISPSKGENLFKVDPPYSNKVTQFNKEFKQDINDFSKRFNTIIQLANETHAQKRLIKELELLKGHFTNNIPFVNEQFSEQMEHTVKEAKGEVEAFITGMVQNYGIEAIRQQAPQLIEGAERKSQ